MVAMTRTPYIPPTVKALPLQLDAVFCVSSTTTEPYEDNGDYDWD